MAAEKAERERVAAERAAERAAAAEAAKAANEAREAERAERREAGYPPFSKRTNMICFLWRGPLLLWQTNSPASSLTKSKL